MTTPTPTPTPALPTVEAALAILEGTPGVLRALVTGVPEAILVRAPSGEGEGQWSVRDVMAHVWVNDAIALERFQRIANEDHPAIASFDEGAMLAASPARAYSVATLRYRVTLRRAGLVTYVRMLSPGQLQRTGEHATVGSMRAVELLHHLAYHDLNHVRQIAALLAEPLDEHRGPLRVF